MRFGIFHELQLPKPWNDGDEHRLFKDALEQFVCADRTGFDYAWQVEHHFLDEYSHSSSPEVFLAAAAMATKTIRLGHGIRQVIANYNHPARTAEGLATLDLLSDGRLDFGFGEGATRLELGGFKISAKQKRAMAVEAAEQIANMMVMDPYPGFEGSSFSMPCRNVLPKPYQKPHPPMWMACTNRDTIVAAARMGVGALAFSFVDPAEAAIWTKLYYDTIKSEACVPIGHAVNANIAMVTGFSVHRDADEAVRRGNEGFEFFRYALQALVAQDNRPGRTDLWGDYQRKKSSTTDKMMNAARDAGNVQVSAIGTPAQVIEHLANLERAGIDQTIMLQQGGRTRHDHICESMELFSREVMPQFAERRVIREAQKAESLAPYIEAALARKVRMKALADDEIPIVFASAEKAVQGAVSKSLAERERTAAE